MNRRTARARTQAPELFAYPPVVSAAADVYAFAVLAWVVCTREQPYRNLQSVETTIGPMLAQAGQILLTPAPVHIPSPLYTPTPTLPLPLPVPLRLPVSLSVPLLVRLPFTLALNLPLALPLFLILP